MTKQYASLLLYTAIAEVVKHNCVVRRDNHSTVTCQYERRPDTELQVFLNFNADPLVKIGSITYRAGGCILMLRGRNTRRCVPNTAEQSTGLNGAGMKTLIRPWAVLWTQIKLVIRGLLPSHFGQQIITYTNGDYLWGRSWLCWRCQYVQIETTDGVVHYVDPKYQQNTGHLREFLQQFAEWKRAMENMVK